MEKEMNLSRVIHLIALIRSPLELQLIQAMCWRSYPHAFFPNAFHRTPCDHSLTTARDHHCEASRPELEVGGSGGRVVLPPSPLKEPRTAGHREPRVEHFRASPTASRLRFVRTAARVAALRRLSIPG
uniref:Uncharacterized protein n=1 Tax=Oryza glumipatula TaxID=40148 RepID=A0A0E0B133_9ORYZ